MLQKLDICGHYLFFINSNLKIDYEHICKLYTCVTWNFLSSLSITTNIENDGKRKTKRNWKPKHLKKFWILTRKIFLLSVIEITYEHVFSIIHITNKCKYRNVSYKNVKVHSNVLPMRKMSDFFDKKRYRSAKVRNRW